MDRPVRSPLARSFERHMRAQNRFRAHHRHLPAGPTQAESFLRERPDRARCDERERDALRPTTLEAATRADLKRSWLVLARRAPSTAATYHKILKVLYAWLLDEQEIEADPMARMKPPTVPASRFRLAAADGSRSCSPPVLVPASRPSAIRR